MSDFKELHEECGIFAGYCSDYNIAPFIKCGLLKLQHRGQESAGLCCGGISQTIYKNYGLVNKALDDSYIVQMNGHFGLGHVRYSTYGDNRKENIQPLKIQYLGEDVSLVHNGQVEQAGKIRDKFERIGEVFLSSNDSEVILKRIVFSIKKPPSKWIFDDIAECLKKNFDLGSYCIAIFTPERILAFRDPLGYRPLMFAKTKEGYFIASEDVAFCGLNVEEIIEINAGEGVEITKEGYKIKKYAHVIQQKRCVFEHIYFASPASNIFSKSVYSSRVELGRLLGCNEDKNLNADVVIPVMDSGLACAIGYHMQTQIPFHPALVKNGWMERSFIQPDEKARKINVRQKFIPIKSQIEGKNMVVVDDSLVRGTTSKEIVSLLKNAGAKSVHMRSVSPRIINTCTWGVDIPTCEELIAYNNTDEQIADFIGAESVRFLPLEDLDKVFDKNNWCKNCFLSNRSEI